MAAIFPAPASYPASVKEVGLDVGGDRWSVRERSWRSARGGGRARGGAARRYAAGGTGTSSPGRGVQAARRRRWRVGYLRGTFGSWWGGTGKARCRGDRGKGVAARHESNADGGGVGSASGGDSFSRTASLARAAAGVPASRGGCIAWRAASKARSAGAPGPPTDIDESLGGLIDSRPPPAIEASTSIPCQLLKKDRYASLATHFHDFPHAR